MYLITDKSTHRIIMWGKQLNYTEGGYPHLVEEDTAFVPDIVNVYNNVTIGEEVTPGKYCYTEQEGFYENTNWVSAEEDALTKNPIYKAGYDQAVLDILGTEAPSHA